MSKRLILNALNHKILLVLMMTIMRKDPINPQKIDCRFKGRGYEWDKLEAELFNQNL